MLCKVELFERAVESAVLLFEAFSVTDALISACPNVS